MIGVSQSGVSGQPICAGDKVRVTAGLYKGEVGWVHDVKMQLAPFVYGVAFGWDDGVFGFQRHELERVDG